MVEITGQTDLSPVNLGFVDALPTASLQEPADFAGLRKLMMEIDPSVDSLLGDISNPQDQEKAFKILHDNQGPRIIGTLINGKIAGFVFNALDSVTCKAIVDIKTTPTVNRKDLFSLVLPQDYVNGIVDMREAGISEDDLSSLRGKCFIRLPFNKEKGILQSLFGQRYLSSELDHPYIQCFIPQENTFIHTLMDRGLEKGFVLAGTSANLSGRGSLSNRVQAASFCALNNIFYLDSVGVPENQRGSYPIVKVTRGIYSVERPTQKEFSNFAELNQYLTEMDNPGCEKTPIEGEVSTEQIEATERLVKELVGA